MILVFKFTFLVLCKKLLFLFKHHRISLYNFTHAIILCDTFNFLLCNILKSPINIKCIFIQSSVIVSMNWGNFDFSYLVMLCLYGVLQNIPQQGIRTKNLAQVLSSIPFIDPKLTTPQSRQPTLWSFLYALIVRPLYRSLVISCPCLGQRHSSYSYY